MKSYRKTKPQPPPWYPESGEYILFRHNPDDDRTWLDARVIDIHLNTVQIIIYPRLQVQTFSKFNFQKHIKMSKQKNEAYNKPKKLVEVLTNEPPQSEQVKFNMVLGDPSSTRLEFDSMDDTLIRLNRYEEQENKEEEEREFLKPAPILTFFLIGMGICALVWWLFFQGVIKVLR